MRRRVPKPAGLEEDDDDEDDDDEETEDVEEEEEEVTLGDLDWGRLAEEKDCPLLMKLSRSDGPRVSKLSRSSLCPEFAVREDDPPNNPIEDSKSSNVEEEEGCRPPKDS